MSGDRKVKAQVREKRKSPVVLRQNLDLPSGFLLQFERVMLDKLLFTSLLEGTSPFNSSQLLNVH